MLSYLSSIQQDRTVEPVCCKCRPFAAGRQIPQRFDSSAIRCTAGFEFPRVARGDREAEVPLYSGQKEPNASLPLNHLCFL